MLRDLAIIIFVTGLALAPAAITAFLEGRLSDDDLVEG